MQVSRGQAGAAATSSAPSSPKDEPWTPLSRTLHHGTKVTMLQETYATQTPHSTMLHKQTICIHTHTHTFLSAGLAMQSWLCYHHHRYHLHATTMNVRLRHTAMHTKTHM